MKALVLESSRLYQAMLKALFESNDFEVEFASSGAKGLELAAAEGVDMVCSALHLPDMSGIELAKQLRSKPQTRHLPVVMLTAENDKAVLGQAMEAGITEIFSKSDTLCLGGYLQYLAHQHATGQSTQGRVLYVEDNPSMAELTQLLLAQLGVEIDHFATGEAAKQAFAQHDYDLVLSDFFLEGEMSGLELLRAVRGAKGNKARVPVLMMSSFSDESRKIELLRSGANDYVAKPFVQAELVARVKNLISNKKMFDQVELQQQQMEAMAMTDQLTGLYNRHYLFDAAPKKISEAIRHHYNISLIVVDLDHFKKVNDTHGHATGDEVLRAAGKMLHDSMRDEDMVARFGGEEFVVLLSHCDEEGALAKAESLRLSLELLEPVGLPVTGSFGVATVYSDQPCDFQALFSRADQSVYLAKEGGRNCVRKG